MTSVVSGKQLLWDGGEWGGGGILRVQSSIG